MERVFGSLRVPSVVRNNAMSLGASQWLEELPALVSSVEHDWAVVVGDSYDFATEAFVAPASLDDGTPAVLKLLIPRDGDAARNEATTLRLGEGEGCARLLRYDAPRAALLLERLGPSLQELSLPIQLRHEILCATAAKLWRPAPGCGLPTAPDNAEWLIRFIITTWEELDRPCSERAVEYALTCAAARIAAHDDERAVLVHGDVHECNALRSDGGFKLIDPDGLLAEAEYDMGILMRGDPFELLSGDAGERSRWLAAHTGLDATAIWEWGVVQRVASGLHSTKVDLQPLGSDLLAVADLVAEQVGA